MKKFELSSSSNLKAENNIILIAAKVDGENHIVPRLYPMPTDVFVNKELQSKANLLTRDLIF
jgi:hypothetical protein